MLRRVMKTLWHLTAYPSLGKSFFSVRTINRIHSATEGDPLLTALTQATPEDWRMETAGINLEKAPVLIVWVAPWAFECIFEGNEPFPLGFCIASTEATDLYSTFFEFMI
jgi:hypothetical protein